MPKTLPVPLRGIHSNSDTHCFPLFHPYGDPPTFSKKSGVSRSFNRHSECEGAKENESPAGYPTTRSYNPKLPPKVKVYSPSGLPTNPALDRDIRIRRVHLKEHGTTDFEHAIFDGMNKNLEPDQLASNTPPPIGSCDGEEWFDYQQRALALLVYRLLALVDAGRDSPSVTCSCATIAGLPTLDGETYIVSLLLKLSTIKLARGDVVLLRRDGSPAIFGIVQDPRPDTNTGFLKDSQRICVRVHKCRLDDLQYTRRLGYHFNLAPFENEYRAIMTLRDSPFCYPILKGSLSRPFKGDASYNSRIKLAYDLDSAQAETLINLLNTEGITLLGGYSTHTDVYLDKILVALANAVLSKQPPRVTDLAKAKPKRKVLLCSTDNVILDRLTLAIKRSFSGYLPTRSALRTGPLASENTDIQDVSLCSVIPAQLDSIMAIGRRYAARIDEIKAKLSSADSSADDACLGSLESKLGKLERLQRKNSAERSLIREKLASELMIKSDLICAHLVDGWIDQSTHEFDMIVVLGASRMPASQALVSFIHTACSSVVLVGDTKDPASQVIGETLFARLARLKPDSVIMTPM